MGLFNAIFIPLPFVSPRFQDSAAGLEMIVWYLLLVAAAATLVREKSRWRSFIAPALSVAGLLLVFALVEGNAGTLFRHRGMVVPLVALLASPTIASILSAIHLRIRPVPGKP
jgi:peptidoglycan/LPS O-acetylase OafA/YrhL